MANNVFPATKNVLGKTLSVEKHDSIARTIEKQKPQDLSKVFDKAGINRWPVLNREKLIPVLH
jgi:hypothetical protein